MSVRDEIEIEHMTKEENYLCGYKDAKCDISNELIEKIENLYSNCEKEYGCNLGTLVFKVNLIEIIKEYCGMEDNNDTDNKV